MIRTWLQRWMSRWSPTAAARMPASGRRPARGPRVEILEDRTLLSVSLLGDLNTTTTAGSSPAGLVDLNGTAYFFANDGGHGVELWASDGTAAGTHLVSDINPGSGSSVSPAPTANGMLPALPRPVVLSGQPYVFFIADDGTGPQVWRSNGNAAGTVPVTTFSSPTPVPLESLTAANGRLFFTRANTLYTSDGSGGSPDVITAGGGGSLNVAGSLAAVGNALYFQADDGLGHNGLWQTDGTSGTASFIGTIDGTVSQLTDVNGQAYFVVTKAGVGGNDVAVWTSNGTAVGRLHDYGTAAGAASSLTVTNLTNVGGKLFFAADDHAASPDLGTELWVSTGEAVTTFPVTDLNAGAGSGIPAGSTFAVLGGKVYFTGDAGQGPQLYVSDGTASHTVPVLDGNGNPVASPVLLSTVGTSLYFQGSNAAGAGLWKTDGTAAGTVFVKADGSVDPLASGTSAAVGAKLFFAPDDGAHGSELWTSGGSAANTGLVTDIDPFTSSDPAEFTAVGKTVYFTADDGVHGRELWASDGTAGSARLVADVNPAGSGLDGLGTSALADVGGTLFFFANDGNLADGAVQLWTTASGGTNRARGFTATAADPAIVNVNGTAFFAADDGTSGLELWKSDGSAGGTSPVKDLNAGPAGSGPMELTAVGSNLFFLANDGTQDGLWVTDGSTVTFLKAGAADLVASNGKLFFTTDDPTNGTQLWQTDGTAPALVKSLGSGTTLLGSPVDAGGTLFFVVNGPNPTPPPLSSTSLWATNGTTTSSLVTFTPAKPGATILVGDLTAVGTTLDFVVDVGNGPALWKSSGLGGSTGLVAALPPSGGGDYQLTNVNGTVFFTATDSNHGQELWLANGTGVALAADIQPGPLSSSPQALASALGKLFLAANDGVHGNEPFAATADTTFATPTHSTLSATPVTSAQGTPVTFVATVTPTSGTLDGGTVDFKEGTTDLGSATLGGDGKFTLPPLTTLGVGTHTVIAYYSGDAAFAASASPGFTVTVTPASNPAPTTTMLTASPTSVVQGQQVTLTATVKPATGNVDGGQVSFKDGSTDLGTRTVDAGGVATLPVTLGPGKHTITASYVGDTNFGPSSSSAVPVTVAATTSIALAAAPSTVSQGQAVTLTATVTASQGTLDGGTVTFQEGGSTLATISVGAGGVATLVKALPVGSHTITAVYNGDANFAPSPVSNTANVTVTSAAGLAGTTTTLSASPTAVAQGQAVTLTATVVAAQGSLTGGNVEFRDGGSVLVTMPVGPSGIVVAHPTLVGVGTHNLVAVYDGNGAFAGSTSAPVGVTVIMSSGANTNTILQASPTTLNAGQTTTLTATVSPLVGNLDGGGSVDFRDGQTDLGSFPVDSTGRATLITALVGGGQHKITAVYTGDANFAGSVSAPVTVTVNGVADTNTGLYVSATSVQFGQPVTLIATVTTATGAVDGGMVDFTDGLKDLGRVPVDANGVATLSPMLPLGTHTITAAYLGDGSFNGSSSTAKTVTVTQPAAPQDTTTTLTPSATTLLPGQPVTLTASVAYHVSGSTGPVDGGSVTFLDGGVALGTMALTGGSASLTVTLGPGKHQLTAVYSGDTAFKSSTSAPVGVDVAAVLVPISGDVTPLVTITLNPVPHHRKGKPVAVTETLTITNDSTMPVQGPISVVLRGLRSTIKVRGAAGSVGPKKRKSPFVVLNLPGGVLQPGQSASVNVTFTGRPNVLVLSAFAASTPR